MVFLFIHVSKGQNAYSQILNEQQQIELAIAISRQGTERMPISINPSEPRIELLTDLDIPSSR